MSTRTRIALTYQGRDYVRGGAAIRELISRCNPQVTPNLLKNHLRNYLGMSKKEKLLKIAEGLPPDFALLLVQEPRRTRKGKSLFHKLVKEGC